MPSFPDRGLPKREAVLKKPLVLKPLGVLSQGALRDLSLIANICKDQVLFKGLSNCGSLVSF